MHRWMGSLRCCVLLGLCTFVLIQCHAWAGGLGGSFTRVMHVGIRLFPSGELNTGSFDEGEGAWLLDRNGDLLDREAIESRFGNSPCQCLEGFKGRILDNLYGISEIRHACQARSSTSVSLPRTPGSPKSSNSHWTPL